MSDERHADAVSEARQWAALHPLHTGATVAIGGLIAEVERLRGEPTIEDTAAEMVRFIAEQEQITRLANFIMEEVPGEPSQSQGAVDTAIRIIRGAMAEIRALEAQTDELRRSTAMYRAEVETLRAKLSLVTQTMHALAAAAAGTGSSPADDESVYCRNCIMKLVETDHGLWCQRCGVITSVALYAEGIPDRVAELIAATGSSPADDET